jgi:hypothetical protein
VSQRFLPARENVSRLIIAYQLTMHLMLNFMPVLTKRRENKRPIEWPCREKVAELVVFAWLI